MTIIKRSYRQFLLVVAIIATLLGAKGLMGKGHTGMGSGEPPRLSYAQALARDISQAPDFEQFQPIQFKVVEGNDPNHPAVEIFSRSLPVDKLCGQPSKVTDELMKMIGWGKPLLIVSLPNHPISASEWDKAERNLFGKLATSLNGSDNLYFERNRIHLYSPIGGAVIDKITDEIRNLPLQDQKAFTYLRYDVAPYASCDSNSGFMVVKVFVLAVRTDSHDPSGKIMKGSGMAEDIAIARLVEMRNEFLTHGNADKTAGKYGDEVAYAMISISFRPDGDVDPDKYALPYAHEVVRQVKAMLYKLAKVPALPEDKPVQEAEL